MGLHCNTCHKLYDPFESHICPGREKDHDPVHYPKHYTQGGIETWDYMRAKMSPEAFEGYLVGNVIKYISRYSKKNGLQDLEKAQTYLSKLIGTYCSTKD